MSIYDILNSIDLSLEKNVKSYNNSFVDKFIDELKNYLYKNDFNKNIELDYQNLPRDTIFYVDYIEEGFASCIDTAQRYSEKYEIPESLLDNSVKGGTYIQLDNGKYVNVSKPEGYSLYD